MQRRAQPYAVAYHKLYKQTTCTYNIIVLLHKCAHKLHLLTMITHGMVPTNITKCAHHNTLKGVVQGQSGAGYWGWAWITTPCKRRGRGVLYRGEGSGVSRCIHVAGVLSNNPK
jgi:hypothetical protein